MRLNLAVLVLLLASCTRTQPIELALTLVDSEPEPLAYEVRVFDTSTGSCPAADEGLRASALRMATLTTGGMFPELEALPAGRYSFAVWGRRPSECTPVLYGCSTITLGETNRVEVELRATAWDGPACEVGTCDGSGRCSGPEIDAGVDVDAGADDAGDIDPDAEVDAGADSGPPGRPCGSVAECGPAGLFACVSSECQQCSPVRVESTRVDINPTAADLRAGVAITTDGASYYVGAAYDTGSTREAAVVTFTLGSLATPAGQSRQDLLGIWPELTEPESISLAFDTSGVNLVVNNLRDPVEAGGGAPPLVFFAREELGSFVSLEAFPHGPDNSPVLGRMLSVGGGRFDDAARPFDVRHVWRLRGETTSTILAAAFGDGSDYRDTWTEREVNPGGTDYVEMVGSGGEWAVMPNGANPVQVLFFNAWRRHSGANPVTATTAPLAGRTGRLAFAYQNADAYLLAFPAGDQLELHRVRCSPTIACVLVDVGPSATTMLAPGATRLAMKSIGDGLALAWADPATRTATVTVFDAALQRVLDEPMLTLDDGDEFSDLQLEVAQRPDGGVELVLVAGVRGPGARDDEVLAAALHFTAGCP